MYATIEGQLQVATDELENNSTVVVQLQMEKDAVCPEREELRAEVVLLQARLRRMEHLGATLESEETSGASSPTTPRVVVTTGDRSVPGTVTGTRAGEDSHPPLRADAPVFGLAEGLPLPIRSPTGGVLEVRVALWRLVSARGSAVTTIISAASAPRSSVIAPSQVGQAK